MNQSNENLFAIFARHFPASKTTPLLRTPDGKVYSYADALDQSARIANCLAALGLHPGDRVTVQVEKSPGAVWLYLACLRGGFVFHPLNTDYQADELRYFVSNAEPAAIICDPARAELFAQLTADAACIVMTHDAAGHGTLRDACRKHVSRFQDQPVRRPKLRYCCIPLVRPECRRVQC